MNVGALLSTERIGPIIMGLGAPVLVVITMAMIVLPLPTFMLDLLFTFNISFALVVLLVSIYTRRPLDFAMFPTVLLIATLMRLALNIASTRIVLLEGHSGGGSAGQVIEAFGEFVIGGNYAVGIVVFAILVIINFVVITKGSTRVSEVSARFTLDAMPGKQMAIDADLNAGVIDQETAKLKRQEIVQEADFYGSMDGASKFVRGDAIAALLILAINVLGGMAVGSAQHGLSLGDAFQTYTILSVGDGLVAQIPALLLATAAGIIVTRVTAEQDMGHAVVGELFGNPKALMVTGVIIATLGLVPGMPHIPFLLLGGAAIAGAIFSGRQAVNREREAKVERKVAPDETKSDDREVSWDDVQAVDPVALEVGYRLVSLVDKERSGEMLARIRGLRKKLSQELGFLIPAVRVRDNLQIAPNAYRILLRGAVVATAQVRPDKVLAIDPGEVTTPLPGTPDEDPVFGMKALWIEPGQRERAQSLGYTVVDPSSVVATHLNRVLSAHAHELLGHEEVQRLLDMLEERMPKLVEELVPKSLPVRALVKVLQNLLRDGVPIKDFAGICEAMADHAPADQSPESLTPKARAAIGRLIVQELNGDSEELPVMSLDAGIEGILRDASQVGEGKFLPIEPGLAEKLRASLHASKEQREIQGQPPILLVQPAIWPAAAEFVRRAVPGMHVLSLAEVPEDKRIRVVGNVSC
jgi:flagellar biosynthesis protein FlhA